MKLTIVAAIVIFLLVIWILVAILLYARKKLVPSGKVKIVINGEKEIEHEENYNKDEEEKKIKY